MNPNVVMENPIDSFKSINYFIGQLNRNTDDYLLIREMLLKDLAYKISLLDSTYHAMLMTYSFFSLLPEQIKNKIHKPTIAVDDNKRENVKILFVTALPVEFNAVTKYLDNKKLLKATETIYEIGEYTIGKNTVKIAVVQTGEGNSASGIHTAIAINKFKSELVFMIGIGGGVKDVNIGDVVVGQYVHYYEFGKDDAEQFKVRPRGFTPSQSILACAEAVDRDENKDWLRLLPDGSAGKDYSILSEPKTYVKPIAAGEKIGASAKSELVRFIKKYYNDTILIEMEGYGFQKAVHKTDKQGIVIRGVSDILKKKSKIDEDTRQKVAAERAAAFGFKSFH